MSFITVYPTCTSECVFTVDLAEETNVPLMRESIALGLSYISEVQFITVMAERVVPCRQVAGAVTESYLLIPRHKERTGEELQGWGQQEIENENENTMYVQGPSMVF